MKDKRWTDVKRSYLKALHVLTKLASISKAHILN